MVLVAAVLKVTVTDSSLCVSLSADGSLRKWSLLNGKQVLCIAEALPVDSESVQLHLFDPKQLLTVYTNKQVPHFYCCNQTGYSFTN